MQQLLLLPIPIQAIILSSIGAGNNGSWDGVLVLVIVYADQIPPEVFNVARALLTSAIVAAGFVYRGALGHIGKRVVDALFPPNRRPPIL